jgi:hypothetical protein
MDRLLESVSRHCSFWKASNGKWYMNLAHEEYGDESDATTYGPFGTEDAAMDYLDANFANPGGFDIDDSGNRSPPSVSPDGTRVEPVQSGGSFGRVSRLHNVSGRASPPPNAQPVAPPVSMSPSATSEMKPKLTTAQRKERAAAAFLSRKEKGQHKELGKKDVYKIYGSKGDAKVSTRVKGRVFTPTAASQFKKGDVANVGFEDDDDHLSVTNPSTGHSQKWKAFEALIREFVLLNN